MLLSFLNLKGKAADPQEDDTLQVIVRKQNSESQEVLISATYDGTPVFQFRKDGFKFIIEQNKNYYVTSESSKKPFVFRIFVDGQDPQVHKCHLFEIEDYLLRSFYQIRI